MLPRIASWRLWLYDDAAVQVLLVECWDKDLMTPDDFMGGFILLPEWFLKYETPHGAYQPPTLLHWPHHQHALGEASMLHTH